MMEFPNTLTDERQWRELTARVASWFSPEALARITGGGASATERYGCEWLLIGGKRWRPLLTAAIYRASVEGPIDAIAPAAVAVECFHKASLIHDDIEDDDNERYGVATVHARYGVPMAINVGDWLIGEGYRLLAGMAFPDDVRSELVRVAAEGHRQLCLGQGNELAYCSEPKPCSEDEVILLYRRKTASAFEVAVQIGAALAGIDEATRSRLSEWTRLIGIAYQIQDDREDFSSVRGRRGDILACRPTLYLALAGASTEQEVRDAVEAAQRDRSPERLERLQTVIAASSIPRSVDALFLTYCRQMRDALDGIAPVPLRGILKRITEGAFPRDAEVKF